LFSQSLAAGIPPLTTKMIGLKLSPERRALHDRLIGMRNQIIAHSDGEMMRMSVGAIEATGWRPVRSDARPVYPRLDLALPAIFLDATQSN
jgi:hypothetical protein